MPHSYVEIAIRANQELQEQLVGILSQTGIEGFWEDGNLLKCYIRTDRWIPALAEELQSLIGIVARSGKSEAPRMTLGTVEDENWNAAWEATIKPIHATSRIVIAPTWHPYTPHGREIVLTIDPKMSFGTGYHESTRLILGLLERHCTPGVTVLDIGTGTGVLAIAAIKLGARSAVAIDNDEWAFTNSLENIRLNHVEGEIKVNQCELAAVSDRRFDLVLANIQRTIIQPLLAEMRDRLAPEGILLLSGLLLADKEPIATSLKEVGLHVIEERIENDWIALAARISSSS